MLYNTPKLDDHDRGVMNLIDELRERLRHRINLSKRWTGSLRRFAFAKAIQGSNSIEGHNVSVQDAVAAVVNDVPTEANPTDWDAISGYRQAMGLILQLADDHTVPCTPELIRSLHYMIVGQDATKHPAMWRNGLIYVRDEKRNIVVYEGPDSEMVPDLMKEFVHSFNLTDDNTPVLVRGAMAHLNLVLIHPFSDGNGRIARCLQSLLLARNGFLGAEFCSIEDYLGQNTPDYYKALATVSQGRWNPENDAKLFVRFCLTAHYQQANHLLAYEKSFERIWNSLEIVLQRRKLPDRSILALSDAIFAGSSRNSIYRREAELSELTAGRDLKLLVDNSLLVPRGQKRGRYYRPSPALMRLARKVFAEEGNRAFVDPYEAVAISSSSGQRQLFERLPLSRLGEGSTARALPPSQAPKADKP
jgi:Fic family protein